MTQLRQDLACDTLDWSAFWALAAQQHVQPLVAHVLSADQLRSYLPTEALCDLKATRIETTANNLALHAELASIRTRLAARDIPILPLKGTHLGERIFGAFDARQCGDIDILVREADWEAATSELMEIGYRPLSSPSPGVRGHSFHDVPMVRATNGRQFVVELHHQLSDPRCVTIDHAMLWQRLLSEGARDDGGYELPTEELLLFLALHLPKHDAGLLRLLADIDHLIANSRMTIDWDHVMTLATDWNAGMLLSFVLESAASILSTPVPERVRRELKASTLRHRLVTYLTGPEAVLRPPTPDHLRANRFRIAYCLMLTPVKTTLASYWRYIIAPPANEPEQALTAINTLGRALKGVAWSALVVNSAIRDHWQLKPNRHRRPTAPRNGSTSQPKTQPHPSGSEN